MDLFSPENLVFSLFFFIPGFLANSSASVFSKIKPFSNWKTPIDLGMTLGGKRILGDHKTIRGFVIGIVFAVFGGYLQFFLIKAGYLETKFSVYNSLKSIILLSFLLGLGALTGDCIKSFFKRRQNIKPGRLWIPLDWMDYFFGAVICSRWYFNPGIKTYLILFPVCLSASCITNIKDFRNKNQSASWRTKIIQELQKSYKGNRKSKDKYVVVLAKPLCKLGVHPNQITALGFLWALLAVYFLFNNHFLFVLFSLFNFISDILDGTLARISKINNPSGKYLDAISDALFGVLLLIKAYLHYQNPLILIPLFLYLWEAKKIENWAPGFYPNIACTKIFFVFQLYTVGIIVQFVVSLFNISMRKVYNLKYDIKS